MKEPVLQTVEDPFTKSLAGRRLGRYEVLARLASGGMAGVYVARAVGVAGFERMFAIKVLHPHLAHEEEFITMFLDEARLAARIRHPNVVPTIDISDTRDRGYYLVMDYIEGDHLGALLQAAFKARERLPAPTVLRIVVDALNGLGAAHGLKDDAGEPMDLVHRDVSPHNIMVSTDGISRLTDFGVAKASFRLSTTAEGQFKGKLAYMAPEHASTGEATQRSDLFSMGTILWECLTGTRLFRAENHAATLNLICHEPIPMPSSVDSDLEPFDAVLAKALARDPDERFQTAEEFVDAIEENAYALGGIGTQRGVSKLVHKYAAEKLERDANLMREAIRALGQAPPGEETDESESQPSTSTTRPMPALPSLPQASPLESSIALEENPFPSRSRRLWIGAGVLVVAAAAVGLGLLLTDRETTPIATPHELPASSPTAPSPVQPAPEPDDEPTGTGEQAPAAEAPGTEPTEQAAASAESPDQGKPRAQRERARERRTRTRSRRPSSSRNEPSRGSRGAKKRRELQAEDLAPNPYRR